MPDPLRPVAILAAIAAHFPTAPDIDEITVAEYAELLGVLATLVAKAETWSALCEEIGRRLEEAADRVEEAQ